MIYKLVYRDGNPYPLTRAIRLERDQYESLRDFVLCLPNSINIQLTEVKDDERNMQEN